MNTVKLEKGIIHLMLPFRFDPAKSAIVENKIWTIAPDEKPALEFLLEHVREFFLRNNNETDINKIDESACLFLKLRNDTLPVKLFNNKIFWLSNKPFNEPVTDRIMRLPVYFDPGSFRLIFYPFTSIAILHYSVELYSQKNNFEEHTLYDFIRMNYLMRVFSRHDEPYLISKNERPEERNKAGLLLETGYSSMFPNLVNGDPAITGWKQGQLINYLLCEMNSKARIRFFNPLHFMPFSYFQTKAELKDENIVSQALFYLGNVYDFDYVPSFSDNQTGHEFLHPYKQIYYAVSLEGAVIFNNSDKSYPAFLREFYSGSFKNSLWVVTLALMQRSIFLQLMKEVSDVDPDDHKKIKEYLKRYAGISLKALFSKISVYHQHNDFYDLIIKKLQINELQAELKDELYDLNNLQRQFHEDEVERHEAVEKQYEKRLNILLFALSVFSLAQVTYAIFESTSMSFGDHCLAIGIPVVLGIAFWKILNTRKKLPD